jgi:hypothetical protein
MEFKLLARVDAHTQKVQIKVGSRVKLEDEAHAQVSLVVFFFI